MIPAGAALTFELRGNSGGSVDALRQGLNESIGGRMSVDAIDVRSLGSFYELLEWQYLATVKVRTWEAYGHIGGPKSIIANAAYQVTGNVPTVGAVGSQLAPEPAGGSGILGGITDAIDQLTRSIGSGVGNVVEPAVGEINKTLLIVGLVLVGGVFLLAGKTTRVGI